MKCKLRKNSSIREKGLYELEEIMGESDGHGGGFGGEDIAWYINYRKNSKSYKRLEVNMNNDDEIEITYEKFYDDFDKDEEDLDLGQLPSKWLNRLQAMIMRHCLKSSIPSWAGDSSLISAKIEYMKITFCWKDPERYCVIKDGDKITQGEDMDWNDPKWIETYERANEILGRYSSGEYVFMTVDTKTEKVTLDPDQRRTPIPLPAVV